MISMMAENPVLGRLFLIATFSALQTKLAVMRLVIA